MLCSTVCVCTIGNECEIKWKVKFVLFFLSLTSSQSLFLSFNLVGKIKRRNYFIFDMTCARVRLIHTNQLIKWKPKWWKQKNKKYLWNSIRVFRWKKFQFLLSHTRLFIGFNCLCLFRILYIAVVAPHWYE